MRSKRHRARKLFRQGKARAQKLENSFCVELAWKRQRFIGLGFWRETSFPFLVIHVGAVEVGGLAASGRPLCLRRLGGLEINRPLVGLGIPSDFAISLDAVSTTHGLKAQQETVLVITRSGFTMNLERAVLMGLGWRAGASARASGDSSRP